MTWLWLRWPDVEERIRGARHTLLLLDYDGTLAPITPVPDQATLPRHTGLILRRVARRRRTTLAVVSGRTVADLRHLVGLRTLAYVGNHGLEAWRNGRHTRLIVPRSSMDAIARLRPRLGSLVRRFPGAFIEDKWSSLCLHYRLVNADQITSLKTAVRLELTRYDRSAALKVMRAKQALEIRPNLQWTKGDACLALMRQIRRRALLPIYIGDDRTDEDAFEALSDGLTIRVGADGRSRARHYVRNIGEVVTFLEWMATRVE